MTPAARLAAAIEVLDTILAGRPADPALTDWGRANRYAGSGDRRALRDLVFDALRCRRSFAWRGGAETGRGLILGGLRAAGVDPTTLLTGDRFAAPPLTEADRGADLRDAPPAVRLDAPDWLLPRLRAALGDATEPVLTAGQSRAPLWLRVNLSRGDAATAIDALAAEGISTRPHPHVKIALEAIDNERRIGRSTAYLTGLVEVQDAASQAVIADLGPVDGLPVLDYCAGAGGKALHLADLGAKVTAHDVDRARMRDLPIRAARAAVRISTASGPELTGRSWPLVLLDAPCSGSGTWRRDPQAKWSLTPARLGDLCALQDRILDAAVPLCASGGRIAYVTCSVLAEENGDRIAAFRARHPGWQPVLSRRLLPGPLGDGFSLTVLRREQESEAPSAP